MPLHRDIHWVGKQWAVTGYGIQACNQRQRGQFDIEASRLWDDGVQDAIRAEKWVNAEDFEKAVAAARKYYPEPPRKTPPPKLVPPLEVKPAPTPQAKLVPPPKPFVVSEPQPKPEPPKFDLRVEGGGKLTPVWRIRTPVAVQPDNPTPE
ncbi:hypothetical protein [Bradyrhizobium erythrophlei]|jgi:hypothetical protein|uniref:Uncharacterized protein n=1 Tax=Bradyrhizobium erythrophlei TaxID=1437360 RepID=A0A1M7UTC4_9BRAD|nr:hypothetical protein [Bradyrhizobium erythrophlei]SHN86209.1 hypothetical protein SAMN05444170_6585 [Bradyrhizobium erythrophlei]